MGRLIVGLMIEVGSFAPNKGNDDVRIVKFLTF
jgi:hypothetical protein